MGIFRGSTLSGDALANIDIVADNIDNVNAVGQNIADVNTVADDIGDVTAVANIAADVGVVAGIAADVSAVENIAANVTSVAGNATNINTVAGISSNVTTVAGISSQVVSVSANATNINTVAADSADIVTVASNISDVIAVAGIDQTDLADVAAIDSDVATVAGIASNVTTVAGISSNVTTVATNNANVTTVATNIANVNAVGTNIANVNSVAGNSTNINAVAGNSTNINTVAGISANVTTVATNNANVTTVAGSIANVNTVAGNISNVNQVAADTVAINSASANATAAANSATAAATSATNAATSAAQASAVALGNEPVRHSVRPSLLLDFANTKTLDPRITFTRASTATFYDGKTVAKAEENLVQRSDDFTVAGWIKSAGVVSANTTTAPDGTTTAETFTANSGTVAPYIISDFGPGMSANTQATHSIFVKKNTHDFVQVWVHNGGANSYANFDVNTGVTGNAGAGVTNHTITSVGNGWYRCSMTFTATSTSLGVGVAIVGSTTATRLQTFSAAGTESIYIWGAQTEARGFLTAYTATTTAPITNYIPALQTAASGVARFEHNPVTGESLGLEIEEQRTNLLLRSEEFQTTWSVSGTGSITTNTVVAPDGTLTADKFILDSTATSGSAAIIQSATKPATSAPYTASIYIKAGEFNSLRLIFRDAANAANLAQAYFNAATGTTSSTSAGGTFTGASSVITAVGNGWYRCSLTATTSTETSLNVRILNYQDGTGTATGDGFSGIYIWGAQLEAGAFATSYIKTEGSQVTRNADSASMTGTNFSSWYRADEGTMYADVLPNASIHNRTSLDFNAGSTSSNFIALLAQRSSSLGILAFVNVNGVSQVNASSQTNADGKTVFAYKVNDFAMTRNGATTFADTDGLVPQGIDRVFIGDDYNGGNAINGTIKKLAYYPKRLTNAELQGLTTV